ncbi:hypothetical protein J5Y09_06770 [Roseomonas sp. PWR1]|uniref:Uncharacterized protein n=1 Tax=Roseomonas nitratireducens TaxID=2820810 RepID=A0ABS4AQH3_9PROT|nr:hypothetical protein [Neoroseomonas nitratireducens]MBP0463606.1 hypothetical protein [Neoroseomonas nitratireducens]
MRALIGRCLLWFIAGARRPQPDEATVRLAIQFARDQIVKDNREFRRW